MSLTGMIHVMSSSTKQLSSRRTSTMLRTIRYANPTSLPESTSIIMNMDRCMQSHEAYKALPAKGSQQVLMQLHHDWDAFFKAHTAYKQDPSKFKAHPKIPGYKQKA